MLFNNQSWFVSIDIVMILFTALAVGLAIIFLIIIIFDKTCHTVPMILVANSCLAELILGSVMLNSAIFTFENDLKQIQYFDSSCILRGYLSYVAIFLQNWSYFLQSIYRYMTVVYPNELLWESKLFQFLLICLIWIFAFIYPLPYILNDEIQYYPNDQICQMSLNFSFLSIYNTLVVYIIPIFSTIFVYFIFVQYIQDMKNLMISINTITRVKCELKIVRRIVFLVVGIAIMNIPYGLFLFWGLFSNVPKYHFRIIYIFVDVLLTFIMIMMFEFTEPLKTSLIQTNSLDEQIQESQDINLLDRKEFCHHIK